MKESNNQTPNITSSTNAAIAPATEIVQTSTIKSEVGTSVIGSINGDTVTPTNNALPNPIDITVKPVSKVKDPTKKIKIVTKRDKVTFIIVVIITILVLGGGGYLIYNYGYLNNPYNFKVKNLAFEIGTELPGSAATYVTSPLTIDGMSFKVDTSNVKDEVGTYSYTVTHKGVTKTGTIKIQDTVGPTVTFKDNLQFVTGSTITKDDLVASCEDVSNCTYELSQAIDTSTTGKQTITIVAKDDAGNTSNPTVTINLIDVAKTITCTSAGIKDAANTYTAVIENVFKFDGSNNLVSQTSTKVVTYSDYSSYFALYNTSKDDSTYTFDKKTFSYSMKNDLNLNNMKTYDEINTYFVNNGYTCK